VFPPNPGPDHPIYIYIYSVVFPAPLVSRDNTVHNISDIFANAHTMHHILINANLRGCFRVLACFPCTKMAAAHTTVQAPHSINANLRGCFRVLACFPGANEVQADIAALSDRLLLCWNLLQEIQQPTSLNSREKAGSRGWHEVRLTPRTHPIYTGHQSQNDQFTHNN
jgi:hypothetical protein